MKRFFKLGSEGGHARGYTQALGGELATESLILSPRHLRSLM